MSEKNISSRAKAYTAAGVDINAGNKLVDRIKELAVKTHCQGVVSGIGGFGGLFKPDMSSITSPILVASTDGVGTKLKLAFAFNKHDTIGIDLVAMNANDILVQGAKPLFFLDYFATSKLDIAIAESVITGIAQGCLKAGCALLGGETAEMPGMYADGEYDLAGFCVGLVDNTAIIDGSSTKIGDNIIGIASSGPHANGYSLIRKILEKSGLKGDDVFPGTQRSVCDVFLEPTIIYAECVKNILRDFPISSMVHITGGGFYDNIPRALPSQVGALINFDSWPVPPVFQWLKEQGNLTWEEMLQIFNCGIGYILIIAQELTNDVLERLSSLDMQAWNIGTITRLADKNDGQVIIKL